MATTKPEAEKPTRVRATGKRFELIQVGPTCFEVLDTAVVDQGGRWEIVSSHLSEATARLNARAQNAAAEEKATAERATA